MVKSLLQIFFLTFLVVHLALSQEDSNRVDLDQLIAEALKNNPGLHAKAAKVESDSARISVTGSLPDPVFGFSLLNVPVNSFSFKQEPMTGKQFSLRQQFPFFGTLGQKEEVVSYEAQASMEDYYEFRNRLVRDVKSLFYDLSYVDAGIDITFEKESLMKSLVAVVQTKYSVGKGLQQDVLKAQVELSRIIEERINFKRQRQKVVAALNGLLNRSPQTVFARAPELKFKPIVFNPESLTETAKERRPLLKKKRLLIARSIADISFSKKKYGPDMSAFIAYTQRDELDNGLPGYDFLSGGVTLSIPLYAGSKQSKDVDRTLANKKQAERNYENSLSALLADLEQTQAELNRNDELVDLYRTGILPQARQALESAITGYQTDRVDFITLLSNYITLFKLELLDQRNVTNYYKSMAQLDFLAGTEFRIKN